MRNKTDLEAIRNYAYMFLELPIDIDNKFEFVCHHPFLRDTFQPIQCEKTEQNPVGIEMVDIRDENNLKRVKAMYKESIDNCKKASDFFIILNKPYCGVFFKYIKNYLDIDDYTNMLESLWTTMEYPNNDVNVSQKEWVSYWRQADLRYIYSKEDKKKLRNLPEEFYVYRGLMENANVKALSWTLDLDKAIWFAKRFNHNGKVYKGLCRKVDILAYLSCRNEEEIVVDWHDLKNIEEVSYI